MAKMEGTITLKQINNFNEGFKNRSANLIAMNAVTRGNLQEIAIRREVLNETNFTFSNDIETAEISNQKQSNTCWLFAELNWLRSLAMKKMNVKNFEFSQNHMIFWDKFEKSNYFLENIISLRNEPLDSREVFFLLHEPANDGGEWHMLANLIRKYGLIPKSVMPDTFNRENTRYLNEILYYKLRYAAANLRKMAKSGKSVEILRKKKLEYLDEIYRILCICLGQPPEKFNFGFKDEEKKFNRETQITPVEFYKKYVDLNPDDVYILMSCPSATLKFNELYTVKYFTNMQGGDEYTWLNVPMKSLKKIALEMVKNNELCLFGCDVLQHSHSKEGILDTELYSYDMIFDTQFDMDKPTRVDFHQTKLTHSMVICGADIIDDQPVKWKIENSWGDQVGKKGFFVMTDQWFEEHVYDLVVPKKYLTSKMLEMFKKKPIELPPWHAMA